MIKRLALGISAAVVLSSCAADPWDFEAVSNMKNAGSAFDAALQQEYVALADYEYGGKYSGGDWDSVKMYTAKARNAAEGHAPAPNDVNAEQVGAAFNELQSARADLLNVLGAGAASVNPLVAAKAQASFDCWNEESEENRQPVRIQECHTNFVNAMNTLHGTPVAVGNTVYFATGSALVDASGRAVIASIANSFRSETVNPNLRIIVTGFTDTTGSADRNFALSQRRADAVVDELVRQGVPQTSIVHCARGQQELAVATGDNVSNHSNRRVVIEIQR